MASVRRGRHGAGGGDIARPTTRGRARRSSRSTSTVSDNSDTRRVTAVETVEELQAAMARATAHVAVGDGVQCEQRRGQVVRSGLLSYTVQWEDGAVED